MSSGGAKADRVYPWRDDHHLGGVDPVQLLQILSLQLSGRGDEVALPADLGLDANPIPVLGGVGVRHGGQLPLAQGMRGMEPGPLPVQSLGHLAAVPKMGVQGLVPFQEGPHPVGELPQVGEQGLLGDEGAGTAREADQFSPRGDGLHRGLSIPPITGEHQHFEAQQGEMGRKFPDVHTLPAHFRLPNVPQGIAMGGEHYHLELRQRGPPHRPPLSSPTPLPVPWNR